ncbi:hypothetical protein B0H14DRAFT_2569446 [Mycena olivaceomarginata]|nr:hypothetical protein B0H14DRAFT_2569446 [Mycena olivaceomarginata]
MTNIEKVWIEMAIAQRSNAKASINASIRIGRKRYWRGLLSDIFLGISMRNVLDVLQKDIFNVWNMPDPENDLSDEATHNYPLTDKAVQAIIEHPLSIIIAGPTAVIVLFAEWHQNADTFIQLDADVVIKKIAEIIMENGAKSEQWEVRGEGLDEYWMTMDVLRDS